MTDDKPNGTTRDKTTREVLLEQDDKKYEGWALILAPFGKFIGKVDKTSRNPIASPIYELHRGMQVDQRAGNAMVFTKVWPVALYPEITELALPDGCPIKYIADMHPNSRRELYEEIGVCVENVRRMKATQDGARIIAPVIHGGRQ